MPAEIYSFFSGVGFLDLGFENAGFNISFVDEFNERFLRAYQYARRNSDHVPLYGYHHDDVRKYLNDENWEAMFPEYQNRNNVIGFVGGPPCPDFSSAGKNAGENGINGQLTSVFVDLIIRRLPDFFVFENVKGLYRTKKHRAFYDRMKGNLEAAGYELFDSIENALEYGTPQFRERLILIGFKRERFGDQLDFNIGANRRYDLNEINLLEWPKTSPYSENGQMEQPTQIIPELTVEYWFHQNCVARHTNGQDIFKIKKEQRFKSIPEGDVGGKSFKRLHRWRYSPTAAYGNNEVHLHPYLPRRLSVAEALAVQSLPQAFELPADLPLSTKFKMVGNGVPYLLAFGIARNVYDWIENHLNEEN